MQDEMIIGAIFLSVILFAGEPDLLDAIIKAVGGY